MGESQACREVPAKVNSDVASSWTPPPPHERYKINVDGAVFASQKEAGLGVLVREAEGRVVGARSKKIMAPLGAVEIEAKAFEFGLHFARDLLIQDFILEGDSLVLVNALKEISPPLSSVAAVVYNSVSATHDFRQVDFSHVRKQGNRLAHLLAKHIIGIADFSILIEENFVL